MEERARQRYEEELADYEAKVRLREDKAKQSGRKPRGRPPQPPAPGARAKDQYNFADPESRIMKDSNGGGFNQHYNVQAAVIGFGYWKGVKKQLYHFSGVHYRTILTTSAQQTLVGMRKACSMR